MQKITPFLWFDNNVEEAVNHYLSIFKNSKVEMMSRYGEGGPGPAGAVMVAKFQLDGMEFLALNGGPHFKFTEAVSFVISCETQDEVDYYWDRLSEGGEESQCGWLKDKFGLSWQVVPSVLGQLVGDPDPEKSGRAMNAMMQMRKLDIAALQSAHDGE